jgi:hypothetical protein
MGRSWAPHSSESGEKFLNVDEESALAEWLNAEPNGRTMEELLDHAVKIRSQGLKDLAPVLCIMGCPGIVGVIEGELTVKSRTWGYAILNKLNLKLATPELLEAVRGEYATSGLIMRWFNQMWPEVSECYNPALMFNFDETMLHTEGRAKVVVTGNKKAFRRKAKAGPHVTLGLCFSPLGFHPPPFIILPTNAVEEFRYLASVNVTKIVCSHSGWMTYDLFAQWAQGFCEWLENYRLMLPEELREKTAVLFIDNCRTHCSLDALSMLARSNVKVITFPPQVTHIVQPIDVGCVRAFKTSLWKNMKYFAKRIDRYISVASEAGRQRAQLVLAAISSVNSCDFRICSNAFRRAGLFPFSPCLHKLTQLFCVESVRLSFLRSRQPTSNVTLNE